MLRTTDVLHAVTPGDWFTSIDLKDTYFQVLVVLHHRQFLRFALEGQVYQFRMLPLASPLPLVHLPGVWLQHLPCSGQQAANTSVLT